MAERPRSRCSQDIHNNSKDLDLVEWVQWLLLKHRLGEALDGAGDQRLLDVSTCLPGTADLVERCQHHYVVLTSRPGRGVHVRGNQGQIGDSNRTSIAADFASMTLDSSCPVAVAQDLLASLVALADGDPARVLRVYASRLCFYCDSQSDPSLRDQVAELSSIPRDTGATSFVSSPLSDVRPQGASFVWPSKRTVSTSLVIFESYPVTVAIESSIEVALQSVGGMMRALEYFTRVLFRGGESDLCVQFLYTDLSSNALGAFSFSATLSEEELNDLLCGRKEYPHVAQMINGCLASRLSSVRRFAYETLANVALFAKTHRGQKAFEMLLRTRLKGLEKDPRLIAVLTALVWEIVFVDEGLQEERLVGSGVSGSYPLLEDLFAESGEVRLVALHSVSRLLFHSWIPAETATLETNEGRLHSEDDAEEDRSHQGDRELFPESTMCPAMAACAEQAVIRLCLALQGRTRGSDIRLRAAARSVAAGLRSRKAPARHLFARSVLVLVDHGLANGSLDGLREHFSASPARSNEYWRPAEMESFDDVISSSSGDEKELEVDDVSVVSMKGGREGERYQEGHGLGFCWSMEGADDDRDDGCGPQKSGGVKKSLDEAAIRYAAAIRFLLTMLSTEDQGSIMVAVESRLAEYFDNGDIFWGYDWTADAIDGGGGNRSLDTRAAAGWLMTGVDVPQQGSLLEGIP